MENKKQFVDFYEKIKGCKNMLFQEKKGAPRINFCSDFDVEDMKDKLTTRKPFIDRMYAFEM